MSAPCAMASPPASRIIATVSSADPSSRSTTTTLAPSRANVSAVARPLPIVSPGVCPPPITTATRPSKRPDMVAFLPGGDAVPRRRRVRSWHDRRHPRLSVLPGLESQTQPSRRVVSGAPQSVPVMVSVNVPSVRFCTPVNVMVPVTPRRIPVKPVIGPASVNSPVTVSGALGAFVTSMLFPQPGLRRPRTSQDPQTSRARRRRAWARHLGPPGPPPPTGRDRGA